MNSSSRLLRMHAQVEHGQRMYPIVNTYKYIISKELIVVLCYVDYRSHEDKQGKMACLPLRPAVGIERG